MKKNIPNSITVLNLASGVMGIIFLLQGKVNFAIYMILLASVFDFLDGTSARLLKAYSDIGKTLDSLADMVSFGVLPGLILYSSLAPAEAEMTIPPFLSYAAILVPVFAGIRLAIFDNDETQKVNFKGLPVPANAIFIGSLSYVFLFLPDSFLHFDTLSFAYLCIGSSILQVIMIDFLSLKFKGLKFKENQLRYLLVISSLILIILFKWAGISLAIFFYIMVSVINSRIAKQKTLKSEK